MKPACKPHNPTVGVNCHTPKLLTRKPKGAGKSAVRPVKAWSLIGLQVHALRVHRGLQCWEVAQMAGLTTKAYCRIEAGDRYCRLDTLRDIVNSLGGRLHIAIPPRAALRKGRR